MGFLLAILYFVTAYLGTTTVFGRLATQVHIELVMAALVFLASLFALPGTFSFKTPQALALAGLSISVLMSIVMTGWVGGGVQAFQAFIPSAFAYFLVCLHFNSRKRLMFLVLSLMFVALFVVASGVVEQVRGLPEFTGVQSGDQVSSYFLAQRNDNGEIFYRLRGQNFLNDPNDFAQLLVCVIPLTFFLWRPKRRVRNLVIVILPVLVMLYGAFLTHSRGSVVALMAVCAVAVRRRIGTIPALIAAGALFAAASVTNFAGGREISANAGAGRLGLWGEGLAMVKSHPLFGVGFGRMQEFTDLTAHNSVVVCATELGLIGLYFWALFVFSSGKSALTIASPDQLSEGQLTVPVENEFPSIQGRKSEEIDKAEIVRLGRLVVLSLTGFLVSGWFLSRAYAMTLFLIGGMAETLFEMALKRNMITIRPQYGRILVQTVGFTFALLIGVYLILRVLNLMH